MLVPTIGPMTRQRFASECNGAGYAVDVRVNKAMKHRAAFRKSGVGNGPQSISTRPSQIERRVATRNCGDLKQSKPGWQVAAALAQMLFP